ncbi:tripartite motif-containing protein 16 [Nothobranchius furzeri]
MKPSVFSHFSSLSYQVTAPDNMAEGIHLERERFCCSLCSDLFNNPVTVPCGHCFCMSCIKKHLDNEQAVGIYSCPRCRENSMQRPQLVKNDMIAHIVEQMRKPRQTSETPSCYPGSEDVACDFCTEKKLKAVKSCLQCLASYCEEHLQHHKDVPALRKHRLVEATANLVESICFQHHEVMKLFCQTDQCCICNVCSEDGHRGHKKVSTEAERAEKDRELQVARQNIQLRIQEKDKDVMAFKQEEDEICQSADSALITTEKAFTELIYMIEKKLSHVKEGILSRQNADVGRYKNVRDKLEDEIAKLTRKDTELDKLSRTENHTHFLLHYHSLAHLDDYKYQPIYKLRRQRNFDRVSVVVSEARNRLEAVLNEEVSKILFAISGTNGVPPVPQAEPEAVASPVQTTAEFVKGRILQNRTSPTSPRSELSQNKENFIQFNGDHVDSNPFPSRGTPKVSKKNFLLAKPYPESNGHDFLPIKTIPKSNFSKPPEKALRQDSSSTSASLRFTKHKMSRAKADVFESQGDIKKKVDLMGTNQIIRSLSRCSLNNADFMRLTPEILLDRVSTRDKLILNRSDFLRVAKQITLDPNTANPHLLITMENREVHYMTDELPYSNHPERFAYSWQVLSKQNLTDRCYLEVEGSGRGVMVALAYKDISRTGTFNECTFGQNDKSWALDCFENSFEFRHNKIKTRIPGTWSSRVGVYLDYKEGLLSFYSVSETMTLLHEVKAKFTQPLHVGFWLSDGASAKVCKFS